VLLTKYFPLEGTGVYYGRQLAIWLEEQFFHWITKKALNELAGEGKINFEQAALGDVTAHSIGPGDTATRVGKPPNHGPHRRIFKSHVHPRARQTWGASS
jgi:hypothetical protein